MDKKCTNDGRLMQQVGGMKFRSDCFSGATSVLLGGWEGLIEEVQTPLQTYFVREGRLLGAHVWPTAPDLVWVWR